MNMEPDGDAFENLAGFENGASDSLSEPSKDALRKAKKRAAVKVAKAVGMPEDRAADWLIALDAFMPDVSGLTAGEDLMDQFLRAFDETTKQKSGVIFSKSAATDQDAASNVEGYYRKSKAMEEMANSEADLIYGLLVAERMAEAHSLKAQEFRALGRVMLGDLVRRRSSVETWKHKLPKSMLAIFAVMDRAGFSSDDTRVHTGLFGRFLDFVVAESKGKVDRAALMKAAVNSEEQFTGYGSDELGRKLRAERCAADGTPELASEASPSSRISAVISELNSRLDGEAGDDVACRTQRDLFVKAQQAGAGLDADGRIIFESVEAFSNCVKGDAPSPTPKQTTVDDVVADEAKPPKQLIEPELAKLPAELEAEVARAQTIRSSRFATSRCERPFDAYRYSSGKAPFQFMPLRERGPENDRLLTVLEPSDFVRLEVGTSGCEFEVMPGRSAVLGRCHELMLPTNAAAVLYGSKLGWPNSESRELMAFGSASRPEKFKPGGDWRLLHKALRGVASLQIRELANVQTSHLLAADEKAKEAAEDLSRWWMFVMFVRLNPERMMAMLPPGYLHGVHGPDVAIEDGKPVMGDSHIRIIDPAQERLELNMTDEEIVAKHGPRHVRRRLFDKV